MLGEHAWFAHTHVCVCLCVCEHFCEFMGLESLRKQTIEDQSLNMEHIA